MKYVYWLVFLVLVACTGLSYAADMKSVELRHFPLNSLEGVRARTGVSFDRAVSVDGKGSLRIDAVGPLQVPLFEVRDVTVEDAILLYRANLQTEDLEGKAYLEMWLHFPGKGEFFSRDLDRPVTGTTSWVRVETPFFLKSGEKPDLIRLNLVIEGKGRVWIDDLRLVREPLSLSSK